MDARNALIEKPPPWGFWKCFGRLRNTGHAWNHKRVYRVYKAMKLNLPRRTRRRLPDCVQQPMIIEAQVNAEWSMDFMSDALYHGRRFRTLNILDEGARELSGAVGRTRSGSTTNRSTYRKFLLTGAGTMR